MKNSSLLKFLCASSLLAAAAARAQVVPMYGASAGTVGQVAIATTEPVEQAETGCNCVRPNYLVAAVVNGSKNLEVIAWQDTFTELVRIGSIVPLDANPIVGLGSTVAAVGLDGTRVVTADVDDTGTLNVITWRLGGTSGLTQQNFASTPASTAQTVAITRLSATQVVTAYQNWSGGLTVEVWNISASGLPTPAGSASGGTANQIGIAAVSPTQVVTAEQDNDGHLKVIAWQVENGTVENGTVTREGDYTDTLAQNVSIGGLGGEAVTTVINGSGDLETVSWEVSSTGAISPVSRGVGGTAFAVAGAEMAVTGLSVTAAIGSTANLDVDVWYGGNINHDQAGTTITSVALTPAGSGEWTGPGTIDFDAYFATAARTSQGNLNITMWSELYQQNLRQVQR